MTHAYTSTDSELTSRMYRRKPRLKEAWTVTYGSMKEIAQWCGGDVIQVNDLDQSYIQIPHTSENLCARPKDTVVKDVETGKFEVWDTDIWLKHYELV